MAFYEDLARDPKSEEEFWTIIDDTFVQVRGALTDYPAETRDEALSGALRGGDVDGDKPTIWPWVGGPSLGYATALRFNFESKCGSCDKTLVRCDIDAKSRENWSPPIWAKHTRWNVRRFRSGICCSLTSGRHFFFTTYSLSLSFLEAAALSAVARTYRDFAISCSMKATQRMVYARAGGGLVEL
jgi:hypothetical protein